MYLENAQKKQGKAALSEKGLERHRGHGPVHKVFLCENWRTFFQAITEFVSSACRAPHVFMNASATENNESGVSDDSTSH